VKRPLQKEAYRTGDASKQDRGRFEESSDMRNEWNRTEKVMKDSQAESVFFRGNVFDANLRYGTDRSLKRVVETIYTTRRVSVSR
jgi:hypothetical protein